MGYSVCLDNVITNCEERTSEGKHITKA